MTHIHTVHNRARQYLPVSIVNLAFQKVPNHVIQGCVFHPSEETASVLEILDKLVVREDFGAHSFGNPIWQNVKVINWVVQEWEVGQVYPILQYAVTYRGIFAKDHKNVLQVRWRCISAWTFLTCFFFFCVLVHFWCVPDDFISFLLPAFFFSSLFSLYWFPLCFWCV